MKSQKKELLPSTEVLEVELTEEIEDAPEEEAEPSEEILEAPEEEQLESVLESLPELPPELLQELLPPVRIKVKAVHAGNLVALKDAPEGKDAAYVNDGEELDVIVDLGDWYEVTRGFIPKSKTVRL